MIRRVALVFLGLVLLVPAPVGAGTVDVEVADFEFRPRQVGNGIGETVRWFSAGTLAPHNVRQDRRLFRNGDPTAAAFEFPLLLSAGTYHYYCEVHGRVDGGMDGIVRIPLTLSEGPADLPFLGRWANGTTQTGTAFDIRFRIDGGPWRVWKTDTTRFAQVFGRNGNPVRVRRGHEYEFQARSQVEPGQPRRVSRWSPVATWMT